MKQRLGVDLGATWLRACLARDGLEIWADTRPAVPWRSLPKSLSEILRRRDAGRLHALVVGGTRLGSPKNRRELLRLLKPLASRVEIAPDFEIAHRAAFAGRPGVILIASTGSLAFARNAAGRRRRAGGLGPLLGDEGSGFWLGRRAVCDERLRRALRLPKALNLAHAEDPVRSIAALAPRVLRGSPALLREAAAHIAALGREAARGLEFPAPVPVAMHGSLFRDAQFKAAVLRRLGPGWTVVEPRTSAARAAAGL